jgi:hypothetical protein
VNTSTQFTARPSRWPQHLDASPAAARSGNGILNLTGIFKSAALAGIGLLAWCSAQAGTLTTDFSTGYPGATEYFKANDSTTLVKGGILKLTDTADLIDPADGVFKDTRLQLNGSYIFPDIDAERGLRLSKLHSKRASAAAVRLLRTALVSCSPTIILEPCSKRLVAPLPA